MLLTAACFLAMQTLFLPSLLPADSTPTPPRGLLDPSNRNDERANAPREARGFLPAPHNSSSTLAVPPWVQATAQYQAFAARIDRDAGLFDCGGGAFIPLAAVNDDHCDCPASAADEPGTAACSGQASGAVGPSPSFLCRVPTGDDDKRVLSTSPSSSLRGRGRGVGEGDGGSSAAADGDDGGGALPDGFVWLPASRVGDGIVDCACGEDEAPGGWADCLS